MNGLAFIHPSFLYALAAVSIPIIIHLLYRKKAIRWRFAAMEFLLRSYKRVARRLQIKQLLLLILRCLLLALLVMAFAKPFFQQAKGNNPVAPRAIVLIVDDSMSMGYRHKNKGPTLFEQARKQVYDMLRTMRGEDKVALLRGAHSTIPFPHEQLELTFSKNTIAKRLRAWQPTYLTTDLSQAMRRAAEILKRVKGYQPHIIVLSDLTQQAFEQSKIPALAGLFTIKLIPVRPKEAPQNIGITHIQTNPAPFASANSYNFSVHIRNYSNKTVRNLPIKLYLNGQPRTRGFVNVAAKTAVQKQFVLQLPKAGFYSGYAEIGPDGLKADNRFYFALRARKRPRVLIVNGDDRDTPYLDELYYLEKALNSPDAPFSLTIKLASGTLPSPALFDVIYLVNVPTLPPDWAPKPRKIPVFRRNNKFPPFPGGKPLRPSSYRLEPGGTSLLQQFVQSGGGLFISVGNQFNPTFFNNRLPGLLPRRLRRKALAAQDLDGTGTALERNFGSIQTQHPIFKTLYRDGILFQSAKVSKLLLVEPHSTQGNTRILWRFSHGPPALLERKVGKGRVLLFTSTLDRDWSDLAIRPYFVSLMEQITVYLAGGARFQQGQGQLVGEPIHLALTGNESVSVRTPKKKKHLLTPTANGFSFLKSFTPGLYTFERKGKALRIMPKVINFDAKESNYTFLSKKKLNNIGTLTAKQAGFSMQQSESLWPTIFLILILMFLVEALILRFL